MKRRKYDSGGAIDLIHSDQVTKRGIIDPALPEKEMVLGQCSDVNQYKKIDRIGEGTYGTVYSAMDRNTNRMVALKRIIMHNEESDGFPVTSLREISCLRKCSSHENCVKLINIAVGSKRDGVFLVFEYCEHDLAILYKYTKKPFKESEIKTLMQQLFSAVSFLHDHLIIHRDIKLSNLLYNNKGQLKLADFGLARKLSQPMAEKKLTLKVVTLWYRAPELLLGATRYSKAIDYWSCGCIFAELLSEGRPIFAGKDEKDQIQIIFKLLGSPTKRIWPDIDIACQLIASGAINLDREQDRYPFNNLYMTFSTLSPDGLELMNLLLAYNPKYRLSTRDAFRHQYFYSSPYPQDAELMPTFPSFHDRVTSELHRASR